MNNPHGPHAVVENFDLRKIGIPECALVESITSWGSMHKNTLHRHAGQLELCYLSLGRRIYVDATRTCVMQGGNVWRNAPGVPHSSMGRPSGSARFYCLDIVPPERGATWCGLDYASAKKAWDVLMTLDPATQPLATSGLLPCFERLFALLKPTPNPQPPTPNLPLAIRMTFNALIAEFVACALMPPKPVEGTEKVRKLIERINASDPRKPLMVQDIVKEEGVSSSYFVNAFQKIVGVTPGQYIASRRIESAARRIAAGATIKSVSEEYGFDTTQHFTRSFNKYFLETPKKYLLRVQADRLIKG